MRSLQTILYRIRADLPITDEEMDRAKRWIAEQKDDRVINILILLVLCAMLGVAIVWMFFK